MCMRVACCAWIGGVATQAPEALSGYLASKLARGHCRQTGHPKALFWAGQEGGDHHSHSYECSIYRLAHHYRMPAPDPRP